LNDEVVTQKIQVKLSFVGGGFPLIQRYREEFTEFWNLLWHTHLEKKVHLSGMSGVRKRSRAKRQQAIAKYMHLALETMNMDLTAA
jgi:hypothetical protein